MILNKEQEAAKKKETEAKRRIHMKKIQEQKKNDAINRILNVGSLE